MNLQNLINTYEESFKAIADNVKAILAEEFTSLLQKSPSVKEVSWTQYTPYFNDGDVCVFSVGEICLILKDEKEDSYPRSVWELSYSKALSREELEPWEKFNKEVFNLIPNEVMLNIFGDHAKVTFTIENGFDIDSYEHD